MKRKWAVLTLLCTSLSLSAELLVEKQSHDGKTTFTYQWSQAPKLSFSLPENLLNKYRGLRKYQPHMTELAVRNALVRKSASLQMTNPGVRIRLSPPNLPIAFTVQADSKQKTLEMQQLMLQEQQRAQRDHLYQGYYFLLEDPVKGAGVIPDHIRFMQDALPQLSEVADAFIKNYGKQNVRQIASALTDWIQQIPYRDLEDRIETNGFGYAPPAQVLFDHQGDCDSKAVLWATIMRQIFPTLEIRILYLPEHAMIAAQVPATELEQIIEIGPDTLLLIDPTGPAPLHIGFVAERWQGYLHNKQFSQRSFPHRKI